MGCLPPFFTVATQLKIIRVACLYTQSLGAKMPEQSEGSPIQDTTQEEEEEEDEDEHDQEVPNLSEEEVDTATSLNASHANRELEQGHELEVPIFQELPQQPQREDDHQQEHHQHTPASPNASHAITEQPREQEQGQEDDEFVDIMTVSPPPESPSKRPVQVSDEENTRGMEKKQKTTVPEDDTPPRPFLEMVLTDIDHEIGFLTSLVNFHETYMVYPYFDSVSLEQFIKNWLQIETSNQKLLEVIVKLRKKYMKTNTKMGVSENFSDARDQAAFNLAHKLWSNEKEEDWKLLKMGIIAPVPHGPDEEPDAAGGDPGCS